MIDAESEWTNFLEERLGAYCLDNDRGVLSQYGTRYPDYELESYGITVENKCVNAPAFMDKIYKILMLHAEPKVYGYGKVQVSRVLETLRNKEEVSKKINAYISRSLENYFKDANKQFSDFQQMKGAVRDGILVLVKQRDDAMPASHYMHHIGRRFNEKKYGVYRFTNIKLVLFMSFDPQRFNGRDVRFICPLVREDARVDFKEKANFIVRSWCTTRHVPWLPANFQHTADGREIIIVPQYE